MNAPPLHAGRRRYARSAAATAAIAAGMLTAGLSVDAAVGPHTASALPLVVTPAAIPPQPQVPATPCTFSAPTAPAGSSWTRLYARADAPQNLDLGIVTDPAAPCRLLRVTDPQTVDRSDDGGGTWRTVLHDAAHTSLTGQPDIACSSQAICPLSTPPFAASTIAVPAAGRVLVGEQGNGDAVVRSDDAGRTWELSDGGIAGQSVARLAFSDTEPRAGYAVTQTQSVQTGAGGLGGTPLPALAGLYRTRDGGRTWEPVRLPTGVGTTDSVAALRIDPMNPARVWLLSETQQAAAGAVNPASTTPVTLFESTDGGGSWSVNTPFVVRAAPHVLDLVVIRSPRHRLRLVVTGATLVAGLPPVLYSDVDGAVWAAISPLPQGFVLQGIASAGAPQPDHLLVMGTVADPATGTTSLHALYAPDGLDRRRLDEIAAPPAPWTAYTASLFRPSPSLTAAAAGVEPVAADHLGGFLASTSLMCNGTSPQRGCPPTSLELRALWRLTTPNGDRLPPGPPPLVAPPLAVAPLAGGCPVPNRAAYPFNGSLTYDGQDLLYTQFSDSSGVADEAVIHKMSPVTCRDTGLIVVHFDPADLTNPQLLAQRHETDPTHPWIGDMAYDARRNALWFGLQCNVPRGTEADYFGSGTCGDSANGYAYGPTGLFVLTVSAVSQSRTDAQAHLAFLNGCSGILAYAFTDDTLWTCDAAAQTPADQQPTGETWLPAGHLTAAGVPLPTCLHASGRGDVGWVVGQPGFLYANDENDRSFDLVDAASCEVTQSYAHRPFVEPKAEDEELACDPLTFDAGAASGRGPVIWLRDAADQTVTAYRIPGGRCPLPTFTRYLSPQVVQRGSAASLCASVDVRFLEGTKPVSAGLPVEFSVDGVPFGTGRTDGHVACTPSLPLGVPDGVHAVDVRFAGSDAYLPSEDVGSLLVVASLQVPSALRVAGAPIAALAPPVPPPVVQPAVTVQSVVQGQAQFEAQVQAQTQSQVQSQAQAQGQPALMARRQEQVRVAAQSAPLQNTLLASALQRRRALALAAAVVLLGGTVAVRPAFAAAAARRRWDGSMPRRRAVRSRS